MSVAYSADEMMTVAAARMLRNGAVCFVGIGLPSTAANLARLTHAPDAVLVYESGPIGAKPPVLPLSIGDGNLAETADTVVSTPEIFRYWLQGGRVDVGFLGAAQLDRFANINTTVVGPYDKAEGAVAGSGRRAGDQFLGQRSSDRREALEAHAGGKARFCYLGRVSHGWRCAREGRPAGKRASRGDYRSVHSSAQSRVKGVGGCEHSSGSGSNDDCREHRLGDSILRGVRARQKLREPLSLTCFANSRHGPPRLMACRETRHESRLPLRCGAHADWPLRRRAGAGARG